MRAFGFFTALMRLSVMCMTMAGLLHAQQMDVDWPQWMERHEMRFDRLPESWEEAPHFGNAMLGSMLYRQDNTLKLQVFRADVHDHRDQSHGWAAYSRPRLQIGHFLLRPVGRLTGCVWRKSLWNAELTGVIRTDRGEIRIRHYVHADRMAIVTELTPDEGEKKCSWSWRPAKANTSHPGYPTDQEGIEDFAQKYGDHYANKLAINQPNPPGRVERLDGAVAWVQDFLVGGQYATAWSERRSVDARTLIVSIAHSQPEMNAARQAAASVRRAHEMGGEERIATHRQWWHDYYRRSFVSISDAGLESLYWQTIYRLGCTSRTGRSFVNGPGIWFQGRSQPCITTSWNLQSAHWPVYSANRLQQGRELVNRLHDRQDELIKAVLPEEWRKDSAYLPMAVAPDFRGSRDDDQRYFQLVGNLPWTMHNAWLQYRYSMDEALLRNTVFPLLRRSINFYLHMIEDGGDGHLRLPPTYSPESGVWEDCNFDLALLKWGCHTLLASSARLRINDPLIPRWREVISRLPEFAVDDYGFMLGSKQSSLADHEHMSNSLMLYPLHLVNIEQEGARDVLVMSFRRAQGAQGQGNLQAMVQAHAGPMGAAIGLGDEALVSLKRLQGYLHPNGLCYDGPGIESSFAVANMIQDMLLQSWSDPALEQSGPIRIFPAMPTHWENAEYHDLRAEGAFLVSAKRKAGKTQWVKIKSLAGEPCRVRSGIEGPVAVSGARNFSVALDTEGVHTIDLRKGEEVWLKPGS